MHIVAESNIHGFATQQPFVCLVWNLEYVHKKITGGTICQGMFIDLFMRNSCSQHSAMCFFKNVCKEWRNYFYRFLVQGVFIQTHKAKKGGVGKNKLLLFIDQPGHR